MRAGERLIAQDGYEVMLFPLEYIVISQGEGGSYSHQGTYNIDFLGWGSNGRVRNCPMYAPCSCHCVATIDANNKGRIFQSNDMVHLADGSLRYVTFMCFHDNNPIASVGSYFTQGDLFAHTGTAGHVTGDHTHFNTAYGTYAGWTINSYNHGMLKNSSHIYNTCYVNDTIIRQGYGYSWKTYQGGIIPPTPTPTFKKYKFKWVLYANKFRERNIV